MKYKTSRRAFFEAYAQQVGFDPLDPQNWNSHKDDLLFVKVPRKTRKKMKLTIKKGIKQVLLYHGQSVAKALQDLFPEIGFEYQFFEGTGETNTTRLENVCV